MSRLSPDTVTAVGSLWADGGQAARSGRAVSSGDVASERAAWSRFCREHGVSRSWFYEVRARAKRESFAEAMAPRPRRSQPHVDDARKLSTIDASHLLSFRAASKPQRAHATALDVQEAAVAKRKELADQGLDHGPVTVRYHLQQAGLPAPATSTLARIFTGVGWSCRNRASGHGPRIDASNTSSCTSAGRWTLSNGP